jgi:transketolase N-terminal domain/subunit
MAQGTGNELHGFARQILALGIEVNNGALAIGLQSADGLLFAFALKRMS